MSSFFAPFYGNIKSLAVNPQDNSLWVLSENPEGSAIAPHRISVVDLLEQKNPNESVKPHPIPEIAKQALGHSTGLYIATETSIFRMSTSGEPKKCFSVDPAFGLQGIIDFRDGQEKYSPKNPKRSEIEKRSHHKLLLIGAKKALVVSIEDDGFSVLTELDPCAGVSATITAWAAESIFEDVTTHHCAFGLSNGGLVVFFTDDDSVNFKKAEVYDAPGV